MYIRRLPRLPSVKSLTHNLPLLAVLLLLGALFAPHNRPLLHCAAIAALGLAGYAISRMARQSTALMLFAVVYVGAWMFYYWHSAWSGTLG